MATWHPPRPSNLTYIIGDIHGCADALARLMSAINKDVERSDLGPVQMVFVGDYVDRGEESAAVLEFLFELHRAHGSYVTCLAGNHELMLLDFLSDPIGRPGKRFLKYGGVQTLASFGVRLPGALEQPSSSDLLDAAADLRIAMGPDLLAWIDALPLSWNSNNLWVVHAGADPHLPMDRQDGRSLLWGHADFHAIQRDDGQWVAVGHEPVEDPCAENGRIAVDTGAVYGGRLTAARVSPDGDVTFIQG